MNGFAEYRKRAGLTQIEVAKHLGVDKSTVAKWESDGVWPRKNILKKLVELYHCSLDKLIHENLPNETMEMCDSTERRPPWRNC